ncbi:site-specific integrase [Vibrio parahaemolyticus]|uniref:site-specific integrase n=1 Tax=Vibrio parahaemolyticus TaxID=670 RepID=UPI00226A2F7C|nr:site-specific integrase [Vibrio parahaemolyticus]MCX8755039.1 site-specific integrase [Vibrio parahaemolyticus]
MYQRLIKGLAIYRQNHTKSIYVRLRINGKEIKRSLSTSDIEEATQKAWALKFELEGMVKAGLDIVPTQKHSIEKACLSVIEELENKANKRPVYKDYALVYNNFIIPYFKGKSIDDLTTKNIRIYFESLELSNTRKNMNKTCFTRLFNYLEEEELLKRKDFPSLPKDIKIQSKKIGINFLESDLKVIREFITSESWLNQKNINFKTQEYRLMFPHVFNFLLETGIRTGDEMNHITFNDFHKDKNNFYVHIRKGKTKEYNQRDVFLNSQSIESLIRIIEITKDISINKNQLLTMKKDEFVFSSSFGKIADWCKLFDQIIKKLLSDKKIKHKYTLYCCRHTYITNALLRDDRDMYLISKQVGNSLEVIQKHYDHVMLKDSKHVEFLSNKKRLVRF